MEQETYLLPFSISNNIACGLGDIDVEQERIELAAKKACIHEAIEATTEKYDALVGDRGIRLSGGQRQRIAMARAFLKDSVEHKNLSYLSTDSLNGFTTFS
jgi:ATP-binding cassette subfamily B protein